MFEKFTSEARNTVTTAVEAAEKRGDPRIGTEHLLLGACRAGVLDPVGVGEATARRELQRLDAEALAAIGIDPGDIASDTPARSRGRRAHRQFTGAGKGVLVQALKEAKLVGSREIGPEHIALAITRLPDHDRAIRVLRGAGVDPDAMRQALLHGA